MVDEVLAMKSGKVAEHGSYDALLDHNGEFAEFVREFFLNGMSPSVHSNSKSTMCIYMYIKCNTIFYDKYNVRNIKKSIIETLIIG